jgi:hypothetical protein
MLSRQREIGFVLAKNVFDEKPMFDIGCSTFEKG